MWEKVHLYPHARQTILSYCETEQKNNLGIISENKGLKNFVEVFPFFNSFLFFKRTTDMQKKIR